MKQRIISTLLAGSLLLSLAACGGKDSGTEAGSETGDSGAAAAPIGTAVEVTDAVRGSMATENTLSGQVVADKTVAVVPLAQGTVNGLKVDVGDTVSEGELLFTIDTSVATAGYGALSSSYAATQDMTDQAIKNAEIAIENARMQLENAQTNLYNTQELFLIGAASQMELDNATDAVTQAAYGVEQAENALAQAQASQKSSLAQIQSSMSSMGAQAQNGRVTAPCDGLVTAVNVVNGGFGGGSAAMTLAEGGRTRISVSVSESIFNTLGVGDTALVTVPSVSAEPYTAMIASIDIAANPQTSLYEVKLYTPDDVEYPIGTFAEVTFFTNRREDVVNVPTEAILTANGEQYVFTLNADGATVTRVPVTTGLIGESATEITSGLNGGETIVVKGQSYLEDGAPVRVVSEG